jgi:hypothetical protein
LLFLFTPLAGQEKTFETPYYPLRPGSTWYYRAGDQKVIIRVEKQELLETKWEAAKDGDKEKGDKVLATRLKVSGSDQSLAEHVAVLSDGVYRLTSAGKAIAPPLRFFKLPLAKGETWHCKSQSEGLTLQGTFTANEEKIAVPAGKFDTMAVQAPDFQIGTRKLSVQYWFAPKVGLVKQRVLEGGREIILELEKYDAGK